MPEFGRGRCGRGFFGIGEEELVDDGDTLQDGRAFIAPRRERDFAVEAEARTETP
jgi:hypothetical protein